MKTVKMSLANLEGKLSRKEMKGIMAGSGGGGGWCGVCQNSVGAWYGSSSYAGCVNFGGWACDGMGVLCYSASWC